MRQPRKHSNSSHVFPRALQAFSSHVLHSGGSSSGNNLRTNITGMTSRKKNFSRMNRGKRHTLLHLFYHAHPIFSFLNSAHLNLPSFSVRFFLKNFNTKYFFHLTVSDNLPYANKAFMIYKRVMKRYQILSELISHKTNLMLIFLLSKLCH